MTAGRSGARSGNAGERVGLQRATRPGVELVERVRGEADEQGAARRCGWTSRPTSGMPTSLSTPVVRPARRCPRTPRSGPLQRSSARPSAATGATRGSSDADEPADEREAQAAVVDRERPEARARRPAAGGRGGGTRGRSRPVARWRSGSSTSSTASPPASGVDRHPRLAAEAGRRAGSRRARARRESARWPDSGSAARARRSRSRTPAPSAWRSRSRRPRCSAKAATPRSASLLEQGAQVAARGRHRRGAAARSARQARPSESAWPLPRRGSRRHARLRPPPRRAVPSREPSSATITSAAGNCAPQGARPSAPMRSSSSRAAIRMESGSGTAQPAGLCPQPPGTRAGSSAGRRLRRSS